MTNDIQDANHTTIDAIFKSLDSAIWIVSAKSGPARGGLTATWVHQGSIDREHPVAHIGIAPNHFTSQLIKSSKRFGLHLLRPDQKDIALRFGAHSGRDLDKFEDLKLSENNREIPILESCYASFQCIVFQEFFAGDRIFFLADIVDAQQSTTGAFMRESDFFSQCTEPEKNGLRAAMDSDIQIHRPMLETWRNSGSSNG